MNSRIGSIGDRIFDTLCHRLCAYDRRCKFYDLSKIHPARRKARSPIIQFYSSVDNIGNLLPVLGIRTMLGQRTDTWCVHDRGMDFDYINANYRCAIVGGAGLLHSCFEHFWRRLGVQCKLPMIVWGVGVCIPDADRHAGVERSVIAKAIQKCDLVNVRDDLTAEHYDLQNAHICLCPTVAYLQRFDPAIRENADSVLLSWHPELVSREEFLSQRRTLKRLRRRVHITDNVQRRYLGLDDIIAGGYCGSDLVVTTRLHGAIIAYALGIPYIAIPRDEKLRSFSRRYGNGGLVGNTRELETALRTPPTVGTRIAMGPVLEFGLRARDWTQTCCGDDVA